MKTRVKYNKPSKLYYLIQLLISLFMLRLFVDWIKKHMYYYVHHTLGLQKAKIGKTSNIHATVIIREGERVEIGEHCLINHNNVLQGGKSVGKIVIGDYVQTGANVMIFAFNHGTDAIDVPMILQDYYDADVIIGDDVWIGAGSVITAGVRIGKGCVIGAGSVVTKDMPANWICAGVPCKPIKERS